MSGCGDESWSKKRSGSLDQPPLMGLDVRRYFFLMTIEPLKVLSRSDAPPSRVFEQVALMAAEESGEYF
jgi:hypothetical protein